MTSTPNSFRDWLCREIRAVLGRSGKPPPFVVWCDPDRSWLDLLRESAAADGFELWGPPSVQEENRSCTAVSRDRSCSNACSPFKLPAPTSTNSWPHVAVSAGR